MKITFNPISFKALKMPEKQARFLDNKLTSSDSVDILCHRDTDNDALSSARAMQIYLDSKNIKSRIITDADEYEYGFKKDDNSLVNFDKITPRMSEGNPLLVVDFNSRDRLNSNIAEFIYAHNKNNILGMDHHKLADCLTDDVILRKEEITPPYKPSNFYIDETAQSCSGIIYRFFESLKIPINKEQTKLIYCGLIDDLNKSKKIEKFTKEEVILKPDVDKNTIEILNSLSNRLSPEEKTKIIKHVNVLDSLSENEINLQKKIFDRIKINGRVAYIEISADDAYWRQAGDDNRRTSAIRNDCINRIFKNDRDDELIPSSLREKLSNVEFAFAAYPNHKNNRYKMSIYSKNTDLQGVFDYLKSKTPAITAGGHVNRAGGSMPLSTNAGHSAFVQKIVSACNDTAQSK